MILNNLSVGDRVNVSVLLFFFLLLDWYLKKRLYIVN